MKITFLGTSSGTPTRQRNVSSLALQLEQQAALWLFDCGEGTQHQILRSPLKLAALEKIFVTHLHGDHVFGLPGLLASRSLQDGATSPVTLYGPPGLAEYLRAVLDLTRTRLHYPYTVETVTPGVVCETAAETVVCAPMAHGVTAFGYAVIERDQPGEFQVEAAQALGIAPGPIYGRLKAGETVTLPDGTTIDGNSLVGAAKRGRKVVYCGDTEFTPRAVALALDADVLIHEATYAQADLPLARRARHATAAMAAETARQAGVNTLILTHFSARYEPERLQDLLREAQAIFPNTYLAHDYQQFPVPRRSAGLSGSG